mgnify:CR=1 FL=1
MSFRSHPIRPLLASLLWCGWVAGAPLATASESHDAPAGAPSIKKPVLAVKAGKEAAPTKAEAPADGKLKLAVAKEAAQDPLDKLRERLAEKLGAVKVPEAGSPNVLRVAARASEPAAPGAEPEQLMGLDIPALVVPGQDASHATSAARYLQECLPRSDYWDIAPAAQLETNVPARLLQFLSAH